MRVDPALMGQHGLYEDVLQRPLATRRELILDIKSALTSGSPLGVSRAGVSEQFWMYYPLLLEKREPQTKLRAFERFLCSHGYKSAGIFPPDPQFYLKFNERYIRDVRDLDYFGMLLEPVMGVEIIRHYGFRNRIIYFKDLIPDRSVPADPARCYLQHFQGKRLLIVCPFAELLRQRATKKTFDGVWSRIGKKWFYPQSVDALEFPYGFLPETHAKYGTALNLVDAIIKEMGQRSFDVALVAAAGLSIPLVAAAKRMGKVAISLGGDLQVLFGVRGKRWKNKERWKRDYFNSWWIDMPEERKPKITGFCQDSYW